jgi:hypothetical protein
MVLLLEELVEAALWRSMDERTPRNLLLKSEAAPMGHIVARLDPFAPETK